MAENIASPRRVAAAHKRRRALELRTKGWTFQQIADELGYEHRQAAHKAVTVELAEIPRHARDQYVQQQLEQIDLMTRSVFEVLETKHYTVSDGRIVYLGDKDDPERTELLDDGPVLNAVDRLLKIQARQAKLLGLDAPVKSEVVTIDSVDAEIRRLERELAGNDPKSVTQES